MATEAPLPVLPDADAPPRILAVPRRRPTPEQVALGLHLASLVAAFAVIAYLERGIWFRVDDFDLLTQRGLHGAALSIWAPHNEHWFTLPILLWRAIFVFAKVRTAHPYLVALCVAHLGLAHVLWRAMRTAGSGPFVATGLAALFAVLGSGSDSILWAFQIGFDSSLLLGWIAILLLNHEGAKPGRDVAALALGILSLATSGVAVTMVVVGAFVAFARRGWRAAAAYALPCAGVYLLWFALVGRHAYDSSQPLRETILQLPGYVTTGLGDLLSSASGASAFGPALFVAVALFAAWRAGRDFRSPAAPAYCAVAGAVVFFVITGFGRDRFGDAESETARYVYIGMALLLPAIGLAVSALVRRSRGVGAAALGILALVGIWNYGRLLAFADHWTALSQQEERQVVAAETIAGRGATVPGTLPLGNLDVSELNLTTLEQFARLGYLPTGVTPAPPDVVAAATQIQLGVTAQPLFSTTGGAFLAYPAGFEAQRLSDGCTQLTAPAGGGAVEEDLSQPASMLLGSSAGQSSRVVATLQLGSERGAPTRFTFDAGKPWWDVAAAPATVQLSLPAGDTVTSCAAPGGG